MEKYLITSSLLDSWQYLLKGQYGNMSDFLSTLKRQPHETTKAQQDGFDFEDYMIENYMPTKNGQYQVKVSKEYTSLNGITYVLYGRLDCLKEGVIYDYKHTNKYEVGKFFNRCQTSMYMELVPEAYKMQYVIGIKKTQYQIQDVNDCPYNLYLEDYRREEVTPIEDVINRFEEWLNLTNLMETYKQYWISKY